MTTILNNQPPVSINVVQRIPVLVTANPTSGPTGGVGATGNPGVVVGTVPPTDHSLLWVDTN